MSEKMPTKAQARRLKLFRSTCGQYVNIAHYGMAKAMHKRGWISSPSYRASVSIDGNAALQRYEAKHGTVTK